MSASHLDTPPRTLIIINPAAARAARLWRDARAHLITLGISFDEHITTRRGDAAERTREALASGYHTIVAMGGDGTLSEAASGFFTRERSDQIQRLINPHAAFALLPSGTGDDFARGLAGGRASLKNWIERLARYQHAVSAGKHTFIKRVDVLDGRASTTVHEAVSHDLNALSSTATRTNHFICLNAATLGIGAEVASRVARQGQLIRRAGGEARFAFAALESLARWRARRVRITVDDLPPFESLTNLLAVMNNRFAGGGMMFSPHAEPNDGLLDVVSTDKLTRRVLLRELMRIHRGGHVANPAVRIMRGAVVRIETAEGDALPVEADGDVRGWTPVEFRIMPRALSVVV